MPALSIFAHLLDINFKARMENSKTLLHVKSQVFGYAVSSAHIFAVVLAKFSLQEIKFQHKERLIRVPAARIPTSKKSTNGHFSQIFEIYVKFIAILSMKV